MVDLRNNTWKWSEMSERIVFVDENRFLFSVWE